MSDIIDEPKFQFFNCLLPSLQPLSRYASNACPRGTGTARAATSIRLPSKLTITCTATRQNSKPAELLSAAPTLTLPHRGREHIGCKNSNSFITVHMRYGSSYLNLPQNGPLPRGGGPGRGAGIQIPKNVCLCLVWKEVYCLRSKREALIRRIANSPLTQPAQSAHKTKENRRYGRRHARVSNLPRVRVGYAATPYAQNPP